jgi:hypothetical protein
MGISTGNRRARNRPGKDAKDETEAKGRKTKHKERV